MAYEHDAKRQATILYNSARTSRSEQSKISSLVDNINQWWKGKGGEAFIQDYKNIDGDITRFLRYIDSAVDSLNRLPSLIDRAERERKEKAALESAKGAGKN